MIDATLIIRKSIQKRQDALYNFKAKKTAFLIQKEKIVKDIEEARKIWESTVEQIPKQTRTRSGLLLMN